MAIQSKQSPLVGGGGQFERLVGVVKRALYKSIGRVSLTWNELEEVLLDVEEALNDRPLSYVEDDVQLPVLTSCAMMSGQPGLVPEESTEEGDADLRKRVKYLRRCKEVLWNRWRGGVSEVSEGKTQFEAQIQKDERQARHSSQAFPRPRWGGTSREAEGRKILP